MTDKPKPLTKAEWEAYKRTVRPVDGTDGRRVIATTDALFDERERHRAALVEVAQRALCQAYGAAPNRGYQEEAECIVAEYLAEQAGTESEGDRT